MTKCYRTVARMIYCYHVDNKFKSVRFLLKIL